MRASKIKRGKVYEYYGEDTGDPNNHDFVKVITKLTPTQVTHFGYPRDAKEKGYTYYLVEFVDDVILMEVSNHNLIR